MLLPIRTSIRPRQTPYANYVLIALNVVFFLLTYWPHTVRLRGYVYQEPLRLWAQQLMLHPANAYLWQFITYAFLHGSVMHIVGNMYFLFLFGNNVNDRLGSVGYVCLYLAGGVFAKSYHPSIIDANVNWMDLAGKDVDQLRVCQQEVGLFLTPGDGDQVFKFHDSIPSPAT